jgi:hypothetical protein
MTFTRYLLAPPRKALSLLRSFRATRERMIVSAAIAAFGLIAVFAVVPPGQPGAAERLRAYIHSHSQTMKVSEYVNAADVTRDEYSASPGIATLIAGGTNYDWAKLILLYGGWPTTNDSVTVLVRWMRQENGAESWWNRNNPLNNGWNSGGGGGTGSYANLDSAAQNVVAMLNGNPGMGGIVADLKAGAPSATIESAIWASPWASGHYGNGSRWHYTPVDQVKAPASAW